MTVPTPPTPEPRQECGVPSVASALTLRQMVLDRRFEVIEVDLPLDGDEPFWYVQDHEHCEPRHTRYGSPEAAYKSLLARLRAVVEENPL